MVMNELQLFESQHPNDAAEADFDALVGLDGHKSTLVDQLALLLDPGRLQGWLARHHPRGLPISDTVARGAPLLILSGEVGCGKTALASSVATPVAKALDARVLCLETPSNIRGSGLVGEVSNRITTAFAMARARLADGRSRYGILLIDEADDLATSRAQLQAHHEDRAALNVLVKQLDSIARDAARLAVVLITNRVSVLDPAIRRRVALHLTFERPSESSRRAIFASLLRGTNCSECELEALVKATSASLIPYSSSDLIHRAGRLALTKARVSDRPFSAAVMLEALGEIDPTPVLDDGLAI
jgi:SpoVK/Ycf46/Vps4 family AAA+-type ATPase